MTLLLDERRIGMLAEFGIRWQASAMAAAVPDVLQVSQHEQPAARISLPTEPTASTPSARAPAETLELVPLAGGIEAMGWDALAGAVSACRACNLCGTRRNTVFGTGDPHADWLIVGDAPSEHEDAEGEPFVGQAGKLLDNMLRALRLSRRDKVFIANVLRCRPPGNRNPEPDELAQCEPFLRRQVELLQPKVIVAMGRFAVQTLLASGDAIGKLRGQRHEYAGVPVVVSYHPAYLLRNLPDKAKAWADLCLAREIAASQVVRTNG